MRTPIKRVVRHLSDYLNSNEVLRPLVPTFVQPDLPELLRAVYSRATPRGEAYVHVQFTFTPKPSGLLEMQVQVDSSQNLSDVYLTDEFSALVERVSEVCADILQTGKRLEIEAGPRTPQHPFAKLVQGVADWVITRIDS